jgi:copper chaperone CopZ
VSTTAQRSYSVAGMTCNHCVLSVREEGAEVDGVTVELASGHLTVSGEGFDDAVRFAVSEAAYEVIS